MSLTSFQLPIRGRPQKPLPTFQTKSHGLSSLLFTTKGPLKRTINNAFRTLDQGLCSFRSYKNSTKKPKLEVATRSGENAISLLDIALQRTAATKPRYSYTFCRNDSNRCTAKIKLHGKEFESDGTHSLQKAAKHCVADVACWWYFYGQMLEQLDSRTGLLGPEASHFSCTHDSRGSIANLSRLPISMLSVGNLPRTRNVRSGWRK